ncbi:MAG: hypothetical protein AAFP69_11095 [Planctomycetota bacterium]
MRIDSLRVLRYEYPEVDLEIVCGSGTYVRSIGVDLAAACDTVAVMSRLTRSAIGSFGNMIWAEDESQQVPLPGVPESPSITTGTVATGMGKLPVQIDPRYLKTLSPPQSHRLIDNALAPATRALGSLLQLQFGEEDCRQLRLGRPAMQQTCPADCAAGTLAMALTMEHQLLGMVHARAGKWWPKKMMPQV